MTGDPDRLKHLWTSNSFTSRTRCARGAGASPPLQNECRRCTTCRCASSLAVCDPDPKPRSSTIASLFDRSFLERRDGWRYDTEIPAIAVVTMRKLNEPQTLQFHSRLQELTTGFDVDADRFTELFTSDEMKTRAWSDFAESRSLGVTGFPTLLARDGEEWAVLTRGFAPADKLLPALSDYLLNRYADAGEALFCEPGTTC